MTQRNRTQRHDRGNRGRSWQVPLSVAVIVISVIAIWRLSGDLFEDTPTAPEPDAEVTAFWVESGHELFNDWRMASPDIVRDIATGGDCFPDVEFKAVSCPDLPDRYQEHRLRVQSLIARANTDDPPTDSVAEEWRDMMVEAWTNLDASLGAYAQIGRDGYSREAWEAQREQHQETVTEPFTEAEFTLARLLLEVEEDSRFPSTQ